MKEEWRDIAGFEGLYQISNLGNVKSFDRIDSLGRLRIGIKRKLIDDKDGYQLVSLHKDGKVFMKKVHRLVAEAFLPNPDNLPFVNHKDENKKNNCVDNLEFCTAKYNVNYGSALKKRGIEHRKPVFAIFLMAQTNGLLL